MSNSLELAELLVRLQSDNARRVLEVRKRLFSDSDGSYLAMAGGYCVYQGKGIAFSEANGLGLNRNPSDEDLESAEAFFRGFGLQMTIKIIPEVEPHLLVCMLHRGYQIREQINVLICDLGNSHPETTPTSPCDISVATSEEDKLWAEIIFRSFKETTDPTDADWRLLLPWFHHPDAINFLARIDERPVGAAIMILREGVAYLLIGCVLPEYRKRGIHKALLQARLTSGISHGATTAIMTGSPGGPTQHNVERMGFRHSLTQLKLQPNSNSGGSHTS
jgi:GNAT superfamily N-acetyltransferase